MSKCDNCDIQKWYARVFDYHIFNEEDCPFIRHDPCVQEKKEAEE